MQVTNIKLTDYSALFFSTNDRRMHFRAADGSSSLARGPLSRHPGAGELVAGRTHSLIVGHREPGQEGRRRGERLGELSAEPRVVVAEALAPPAQQLAVELRLLELGPRPPVLEPHLHLPRPQAQLLCQGCLLPLHVVRSSTQGLESEYRSSREILRTA